MITLQELIEEAGLSLEEAQGLVEEGLIKVAQPFNAKELKELHSLSAKVFVKAGYDD